VSGSKPLAALHAGPGRTACRACLGALHAVPGLDPRMHVAFVYCQCAWSCGMPAHLARQHVALILQPVDERLCERVAWPHAELVFQEQVVLQLLVLGPQLLNRRSVAATGVTALSGALTPPTRPHILSHPPPRPTPQPLRAPTSACPSRTCAPACPSGPSWRSPKTSLGLRQGSARQGVRRRGAPRPPHQVVPKKAVMARMCFPMERSRTFRRHGCAAPGLRRRPGGPSEPSSRLRPPPAPSTRARAR
jgi:hypothetical protein